MSGFTIKGNVTSKKVPNDWYVHQKAKWMKTQTK